MKKFAYKLRSIRNRDAEKGPSAFTIRFVLEPIAFKNRPTKCQWGPIGHLYNLGWSMGSPWWPYGGRLSDPFSDFLPPTSALAKKKLLLQGGSEALLIDAARRKGSETGLRLFFTFLEVE